MRYEIPAVIVVDAAGVDAAHEKSLALGATLDREEGPGAFFYGITTAAVGLPKACEEDRQSENLSEHAESLQSAAGVA